MKFSSRAVLLLSLVVCLTRSQPINGNAETDAETQGSTVRPAKESSRQHFGRHWTTSLHGPYKKIVSSGISGISSFAEDDDVPEQDRKQHRLHRQFQEEPTDNSSSTHSSSDVNTQRNATKLEIVRNRINRDFSSSSLSRRIANYHSTESTVQSTVASNKKRRRLSHYNVATSTAAPQTMSDSLYNYFRPLEQDLPEDDILPFLDFGKKLSPSLPTPSGINSIENKSTGTRLKPKELHSTSTSINSTPVDEEVLPEDMDVTVVKKAVERNYAPRTPFQTHVPVISHYYRRKPTNRTADNLVITPDCPTPTPGHNNTKNSQSIKKMTRQHYRQVETESGESKCDMSNAEKPKEMQNTSTNSMSGISIEIQKQQGDRLQKGGTHAENYTASPVAAESSLVRSVKQIEAPQVMNFNTTGEIAINITGGLKPYSTVVSDGYDKVENVSAAQRVNKIDSNVSMAVQKGNTKTISATATSSPNSQLTTRILSTAVVTSVSLKESSLNNSVKGPPSPQLTTQARLVNTTIDRTDYTSEIDISGTQSIGNSSLLEKVIPTEKLNRSSHSLVVEKNGEVSSNNFTSTERIFPIGSVQTTSRSNRSSAVEKSGKQLTVNFTSSERVIPVKPLQANRTPVAEKNGKHSIVNLTSSERVVPVEPLQANRTPVAEKSVEHSTADLTSSERVIPVEPLQANHMPVAEKSVKHVTVNITSSERVIPVEPQQANHTPVAEKSVKHLTVNLTSSERVIPIEPLQANHTPVAEKSVKHVTVNLTSSERVIPIESLQANHTPVAEKSVKHVTVNLTSSERVIPIEPSQPTSRSNRTSEIEKSDKDSTGSFTSSERVILTELSAAANRSNRTSTVEISGTTLTDNFTSTELMQTSLTTNRTYPDGSTDHETEIETTTVSLSPASVTTNLPKTAVHEEYALDVDPNNSSTGDLNRSSESLGKATTDSSIYVNNNTIADLMATDVYYDYDESNLQPGTLSEPETEDRNNTTKFVHTIPEDAIDEDSWLQNIINSTVIEQNVGVAYPQPTIESSTYVLVGLSIIPILLGAVVVARFFLLRNKKKVLDESEYSSEYNRSPLSISNASPLPTKLPRVPQHLGWEMEKSPPSVPSSLPSSKWEFPREKLRLQTILGQGNFGQVWKAEADDISGHEGLTRLVAVKTVKESASAREREDLLRELGLMQDLGSHPNVVTLLGCCTEKEPYYLIMEYVMYGKLLTFLRDHRTRAHYYNFSDVTDALTSRDLTVFIYCVARGMDYLTNKGIIHRDLAARNVLVDHNKLCKIADFGMSRNVRDTGQIYEQRQSKGALPIRWMAPESLHYSLFTHKSDVWSFGILMWEIVTLGSTPYATMGAREVMRRVRDGYRLERPSHCRPELFRVISRCWHADPSKRPNFAELKHEIGQLLSDTERGGNYIDLDSLHEEMKQSSQGSTLQRNQ